MGVFARSPATLAARRKGRFGHYEKRGQGARVAKHRLRTSGSPPRGDEKQMERQQRETELKRRPNLVRQRGAPGQVGFHPKYSLSDPRLIWYRDPNRIPPPKPPIRSPSDEYWRRIAYPEGDPEAKAEAEHWLTGVGALDRVRLVVVGSQSAGNVGSICRVASNFECRQVWLVNPECDYTADEARQRAVNPAAKTLLEEIKVAKSIPEAIAECNMAIGFTRREGRDRITNVPFERVTLPAKDTTTALVFGREDNGLTNEELLYCTHSCCIPTTKWEGSLNVSHAVALTLSGIFRSYHKHKATRANPDPYTNKYLTPIEAAPLGEIDLLIRRWRLVMKHCNEAAAMVSAPTFSTPHRLLIKMRRILTRARTTQREVNIMHGFLTLVHSNAYAVGNLFTKMQEQDSAAENTDEDEDDYEQFVKNAEKQEEDLWEERSWEEFDYDESESEDEGLKKEIEDYL